MTSQLTPREQVRRDMHITFEALAVFVLAPALWAAAREVRSPGTRRVIQLAVIATIIVDGGLLASYMQDKHNEKNSPGLLGGKPRS